jgi:hypothetical protein
MKIDVDLNIERAAQNTYDFINSLNDFLKLDASDYQDPDHIIDKIENIMFNFQPAMSSWVVLEYLKEQNK